MKIAAMTVEGNVGELPAYVYDGSLTVGASVQDNMIPFPASYRETVHLRMMLSSDARVILVSGSEMSIEVEGEFRFVEPTDYFTDPLPR
jgi:hypothetical protein